MDCLWIIENIRGAFKSSSRRTNHVFINESNSIVALSKAVGETDATVSLEHEAIVAFESADAAEEPVNKATLAAERKKNKQLERELRKKEKALAEMAAILCYIVALTNLPIADASALGQITPFDVLLIVLLAIALSASVTLLCVLLNYLLPQGALELLMSLAVAGLVINWAMISYSHFKFRQHMNKTQQTPLFKALWYPYGNYVCLAFVAFILGVMLLIPGIQISVYAIPVWVVFMWACYVIKNKRGAQQAVAHAALALFGALLSAIKSTSSATLLAPSTSFVENILRNIYPHLTDKQVLLALRISVLVFTGSVLTYAVAMEGTSIYELVSGAYQVPLVGAFVPLVFGLGAPLVAMVGTCIGAGQRQRAGIQRQPQGQRLGVAAHRAAGRQ